MIKYPDTTPLPYVGTSCWGYGDPWRQEAGICLSGDLGWFILCDYVDVVSVKRRLGWMSRWRNRDRAA